MDKSWMKKRKGDREYIEGVLSFVEFASKNARGGKILCPCTKCVNLDLVPPGVAQAHLWSNGMLGSYTYWKFHGESAAAPTTLECGSSHAQDSHEHYGDFRGMLHDLCSTHEMATEVMGEGEIAQQPTEGLNDGAQKFYKMIDDVDKPLYAAYAKLPKDHYEAKKIVRDLGLDYEKIHACLNDCMLFWKENVNLEECPCCKISSWKMNEASVTDDGVMWHPADLDAWKMFDNMHLQFSFEPHNVRLGLAADGFNPFGIIRIVIDVYLQPLVEELRELWDVGVEAFDASSKNVFQLHAALMWTVHDFPVYADVSGWSTKGEFACPCCASETDSRYLKHGHKFCYMGHRRWLDSDHEFRDEDTLFDGSTDMQVAPVAPVASDILVDTESLVGRYLGKKCQLLRGETNLRGWKKRSIFFSLPYWEDHKLRHNLDVIHIEKNVMDNILGTVLNLKDWTKDNYKARLTQRTWE
ncbi:uncharacterized protein LOC136063750 [Quercus suber]|uniref:uncharacterized protein LOC136063750 n=1 Tax=Quercus suber TaxID=58331 RepID=UPI0032DE8607